MWPHFSTLYGLFNKCHLLCLIFVSLVCHQFFTNCLTNVSAEFHQFFNSLSPAFKSVSKVFKSCLFELKSSQVPKPKEGLYDPKIFLIENFSAKKVCTNLFTPIVFYSKNLSHSISCTFWGFQAPEIVPF